MLRFIRKILILFVLIAIIAAAGIGVKLYQGIQSYKNPSQVTIQIPKGASVRKIARLLSDKNVVADKYIFEAYVRFEGVGAQLKAGEYEFKEGLTMKVVAGKMAAGKVKLYRFTIPEGFNIYGICAVLEKQKLMRMKVCTQQVRRVDLLKQKPAKAKTLEGYLFPDTYTYQYDTKQTDFIEQMVALFYKKVGDERIAKAKKMGFSLYELITFASIVEKETGKQSERPLIASVFHNRLRIGMLLQTDPTVIYGIQGYDGNIRKKDLTKDTPYNTYTRAGLPVGPICSVGLDAIDAVLEPAKSDYLYFVAKGDGSHYFSKTLAQHNRAVQYYQLKRGPAPK
jgi:UPF0755 protein